MFASLPRQVVPGCAVFLLPLSASMQTPLPGQTERQTRGRAARRLIDAAIDVLVRLHRQGALDGSFAVAVVGHTAPPGQSPAFVSLWPGEEEKPPRFRPVADLAAADPKPRADGPPRWTRPGSGAGEPNSGETLVYAHGLVRRWLQEHPGGGPPLVVHCHDERDPGGLHARAACSLQTLATPGGQALLLNWALGDEALDPGGAAAGPWRALWECSSPLPGGEPGEAGLAPRGLAVNTFSGARKMLQELLTPWALPMPAEGAPGGVPFAEKLLWLVKQGNAEGEWEDACATDAQRGVAAVCDGASEGIFARTWARLLADRFVAAGPDLAEPALRSGWLDECRAAWKEAIGFPTLRWSQKNKVVSTGAAATFLSLQLAGMEGAADGVGWRALAVGDSCLFWARDNRLLASFPLCHSGQFALGPPLLRTRVEGPDPAPLLGRGLCRPGDVFVLATDAVAAHLLALCEAGTPPDWEGFAALEPETWREQVASLRRDGRMVNDDCTLLLVRVGREESCHGD